MILVLAFVAWLCWIEFRTTGGRHTPALYFLLYMLILVVICTLLSSQMPFSLAGFFFLAVVAGAFWLGHLCGAMAFGNTFGNQGARIADTLAIQPVPVILKTTIVTGVIAGILAIMTLIQVARDRGIEIAGISDLAKLPAYFSALRYTPGAAAFEPVSVTLLITVLDAASVAGGLLFTLKGPPRQRAYSILPLIVALLLTLTTGARSHLFVSCTWFFGSLIAIKCAEGTEFTQLRSVKFLLISATGLGVAFLFASAFQLLRYSAENLQQPSLAQFMTKLAPLMATTLQSIVTATTVFDKTAAPGAQLHFAAYTFSHLTAWLGMESVLYPPDVYLKNGLSNSNQYSLFGFMMLDFGPTITAIIFFFTGMLSAVSVFLIRTGLLVAGPILIAIMCVILFSLIHNFFYFTTHIALVVVMTISCAILQKFVQHRADTAHE